MSKSKTIGTRWLFAFIMIFVMSVCGFTHAVPANAEEAGGIETGQFDPSDDVQDKEDGQDESLPAEQDAGAKTGDEAEGRSENPAGDPDNANAPPAEEDRTAGGEQESARPRRQGADRQSLTDMLIRATGLNAFRSGTDKTLAALSSLGGDLLMAEADTPKYRVSIQWDDKGDENGWRPESVQVALKETYEEGGYIADYWAYSPKQPLHTVDGEGDSWTSDLLEPSGGKAISGAWVIFPSSTRQRYTLKSVTKTTEDETTVYNFKLQLNYVNTTLTVNWVGDEGHEDQRPSSLETTTNWVEILFGDEGSISKTLDISGMIEDSYTLDVLVDGDLQNFWSDGWFDHMLGYENGIYYPYNERGSYDVYVPSVNEVPGYTKSEVTQTSYHAYEVTYTYDEPEEPQDETISVPVAKEWEDNEDEFGNRPDSIDVSLYAYDAEEYEETGETENRVLIDTMTLTAEDDWQGTFEDVPATDENGDPVHYLVDEEAVPTGYYKAGYYHGTLFDGTNPAVLTNITDKLDMINIEKRWNGDEEEERPDYIVVNLKGNGETVASWTLTSEDAMSEDDGVVWEKVGIQLDAPFARNGEPVKYTIEEEPVDGYSSTIDQEDIDNHGEGQPGEDGDHTDGYWIYITNTLEPEDDPVVPATPEPQVAAISVNKVWEDDNDADGIRPKSITIRLHANGEQVASAELTEATGWEYTFDGLDVVDDGGNKIVYTITEDEVEGYEASIEEVFLTGAPIFKNQKMFTVLNTRIKAQNKVKEKRKTLPDIPQLGDATAPTIAVVAVIATCGGSIAWTKRR